MQYKRHRINIVYATDAKVVFGNFLLLFITCGRETPNPYNTFYGLAVFNKIDFWLFRCKLNFNIVLQTMN